ncbi:MAG: hypothetical protein JSS60_06765 [Verrucomicrobia bacterium]|nr:hypothetical protein [Verrucomicrobiota bacterium]
MAGQVKDSLLVRTILSPQFNFADATVKDGTTQGAINKQSLINRVKKMDQPDRQALMAELTFMSARLNAPGAARAADRLKPENLSEKGLSVLFLTDDGLPLETHNFFITFMIACVRTLANTFGERVSSSAIIEKFETVRADLIDPAKQALVLNDNVNVALDQIVPALELRVRELQALQIAPTGNDKLEAAKKKLVELDQQLQSLSANPDDILKRASILANITQLQQYVNSDATVFDAQRKGFIAPLAEVQALLSELNKAASMQHVAQYILDNIPITDEQRTDLIALKDGTRISAEKKQKSYWIENLLVPFASRLVRTAFYQFDQEIRSTSSRQARVTSELTTVQTRLAKFQRDLVVDEKRGQLLTALDLQERSEKSHNAVSEVLNLVNQLSALKTKTFFELQSFVASIHLVVQDSPEIDAIKDAPVSGNPAKTFGQCLGYIDDVLKGNNASLAELKASIQPDVYLAELDDRTLYNRMRAFVSNQPVAEYDLGTEAGKKTFVNDYVEYMKIVLEKKKNAAERDFSQKTEAVERLDRELQSLVTQVIAQTTPSAVVLGHPDPLHVPVGDDAIPQLVIPPAAPDHVINGTAQAERQKLVPLAIAVQTARATDNAAYEYYKQVKGLPIADSVYANFYFILRNAGKIQRDEWGFGQNVFLREGGWRDKVAAMTETELNHFRVQAMQEAINGVTRNS